MNIYFYRIQMVYKRATRGGVFAQDYERTIKNDQVQQPGAKSEFKPRCMNKMKLTIASEPCTRIRKCCDSKSIFKESRVLIKGMGAAVLF